MYISAKLRHARISVSNAMVWVVLKSPRRRPRSSRKDLKISSNAKLDALRNIKSQRTAEDAGGAAEANSKNDGSSN